MKLYVANCTKHIQDFVYRIPEVESIKRQIIPIGSQAVIYGDTTKVVIDYIIEQHARYGLAPANEVDRRKDQFTGLCYSIDKPVNMEVVLRAVEQNDDYLENQSLESRKTALASIDELLGQNGDKNRPDGLTVEITEEKKKGDNTPGMTQTLEIAREGSKTAQRQGARQERKRSK